MLETRAEPASRCAYYVVRFTCPEFTSLCPITGQPDFAHLVIDYVPDATLVESKSLKLYLGSLPQPRRLPRGLHVGIARRLVEASGRAWLRIGGYWYPRGGIPIDVFWQTGAPPRAVAARPRRRALSRPRVMDLPDQPPISPPHPPSASRRVPPSPSGRGSLNQALSLSQRERAGVRVLPIREAIRAQALALGFDAVGFAKAQNRLVRGQRHDRRNRPKNNRITAHF